jgi:hypothetical protein
VILLISRALFPLNDFESGKQKMQVASNPFSDTYASKFATSLKLKSPAFHARLFSVAGARFELAAFGL